MTELAEIGRGFVAARPFDVAPASSKRPFDVAAERGERPLAVAAEGGEPAAARPLDPLQAELIAAAGAALLLVSLMVLPWFGVDQAVGRFAPRAATIGSEGAWHTLTLLRWMVLLAVAVAFVPVLARPAHRWLGVPRLTNAVVAGLGGLTALALGYRVLIDLPDPSRVVDQRAGAILGLLGALVITLGGLESIRADAARARAREVRTRARRAGIPPGEPARGNR